jgi:hypothetical protein
VSFGLNGSTVTAKHALNFSGGTTSNNISDQLIFSNLAGGVAFGLNGSTLTASDNNYQSYHRLWDPNNTQTFSFGQSTSYFQPFELSRNLSMDRVRVVASGAFGASTTQATTGGTSLSMSAVTSHNIVLYTRGAGANSQSLVYYTSTQHVDQCLMTMSINANSTQYSVSLRYTLGSNSFTKDYSVSQNSLQWHTSHITDLSGVKYLDVPFGISLPPNQYWIGYGRSTTSNTQANSISEATKMIVSQNSMIAVSQNTLAMGMLGGATDSSVGWLPGHGSFTLGGAAGTTTSLGFANVSTTASNNGLYAQFMRIA